MSATLKNHSIFYKNILGFQLKHPDESTEDPVINLANDYAGIQLSSIDGTISAVVKVRVNDAHGLFETFIKRGLDTSKKKESPVHRVPLDQTWGMREFYVTDYDGHTFVLASLYNYSRTIWPSRKLR